MKPDDIPPPDQPITVEAYSGRWPSGTEKCELFDGSLVFQGSFDERDVQAAERIYPGRRVVVNADGGLEVHPAGPPRGVWAKLAAGTGQDSSSTGSSTSSEVAGRNPARA